MVTKKYEIASVEAGSTLELAETPDRLTLNVSVNVKGVRLTVTLDREGFLDLFGLQYKLEVNRPNEVGDD